jgi:hypothetical protein
MCKRGDYLVKARNGKIQHRIRSWGDVAPDVGLAVCGIVALGGEDHVQGEPFGPDYLDCRTCLAKLPTDIRRNDEDRDQ